jgi:endonuclease III
MTTSNRASKLESLYKSLKKHFKPVPDAPERTVLEHLLYACCLEDARFDQADEAFAKLQQTYFDWNEVRVTTTSELGDSLQSLPFASQAANRIKQCLQALFESRYQYDIDDLKKANLGKAVAELEAWKGMSPFIVSYVSQQALGGHSIPISNVILDALVQCEVISPTEAEKKSVPGLERAIPKNKGIEFGALLQQFALELHSHPKSNPVQSLLKEMGVVYKAKPKLDDKTASGTKPATTSDTKARGKSPAIPTPSSEGPTSKTTPPKPTPAKTPPTKTPPTKTPPSKAATSHASETSSRDVKGKQDKAISKQGKKDEVLPNQPGKAPASKKMAAPPPSKGKSSAIPPSSTKNKKGSSDETNAKRLASSTGGKDAKSKPSAKPKPADSANKKRDSSKELKRSGSGKPSAGSISSNLTKKKPK